MVHCSPILSNPMASLLHDLSSSDSSTASSPVLSYCSGSSTAWSSLAPSPSPSPSPLPLSLPIPTKGRTRRTSSMGSRTSQMSSHSHSNSSVRSSSSSSSSSSSRSRGDNLNDYGFDSHSRRTSGYSSQQETYSNVGMGMKKRSVTHSASPLSKTANCTTATDVARLDDSPQAIAQSSARYIRFLLLPLLPLLFLALGGQTNPKFDTPARYM
ncbi:hypothetical protein BGZ96_008345 [Linnemannia gamsii]|uniref:Uncharacterized protein n=1 Tax=Linnemannia gamsii TaxID=64522 RepID=A0ABQ7JYL5_9FUNG|nr:hypothetical protein BGZ96_008345 [Linnemannia gamsii]